MIVIKNILGNFSLLSNRIIGSLNTFIEIDNNMGRIQPDFIEIFCNVNLVLRQRIINYFEKTSKSEFVYSLFLILNRVKKEWKKNVV